MDALAVELFERFGRFEYALKRSQFLNGPVGGDARADWDGFANRLGANFFDFHFANTDQNADRAELFAVPPRKGIVVQVQVAGEWTRQFGWRDMPIPENAVELMLAVRRVRNNLFHGDKANPDYSRNPQLVRAANLILSDARSRAMAAPTMGLLAGFL